MRVDVMSKMRGVDAFPKLWKRRTTIELPDGTRCDLLSLPDLVQAKKTQCDKDWPMIRRLVEAHYFQNNCFMKENQLLAEAGKLERIPGIMVQGRYDLLCPPSTSHALATMWPSSEVRCIEGAGHSLYDPGIRNAVMKAVADMASRVTG